MAIAVWEPALSRQKRPPTPEGLALAEVIRQIRRERKLTQQQVADNWPMSVDGYRPWERGERRLRVDQIPILAKALTVSEDDLKDRLGAATDPARRGGIRREIAAKIGAEHAEIVEEMAGGRAGARPGDHAVHHHELAVFKT